MAEMGEPDRGSGPGGHQDAPPGQDTSGEGVLELRFVEIRGLYRPGYSDRRQRADRRPIRCGYQLGYTSLDNRGRIFINHRPRRNQRENWQRVRRRDQQYIHAIVRVIDPRGALPSSARVEWVIVDPDDPSDAGMHAAAAQRIDRNRSRGADNQGTVDFSGPSGNRFEEVSGFPATPSRALMHTEIVGGRSEVKLHCTNVGGDNFRLRARIINGPSSAPMVETGIMTMWKRLDVEYHKMSRLPELRVDDVARAFEVAFIQLDFTSSFRLTHQRHFIRGGATGVTGRFCSRHFSRRGSAGWLFLALADAYSDRGSTSRQVYPPPPRSSAPGVLTTTTSGGYREIVQIPVTLPAPATALELHNGSQTLTFYVENSQTVGSATDVEVKPLHYYPQINPGDGSYGDISADQEEFFPARDLGFSSTVDCRVHTGQAIGAAGVTPYYQHGSGYYMGGRSVVFMAHQSDAADAVQTAVHEITHGLGFEHGCGRRSVRGSRACAMAILDHWLFRNGTETIERWTTARSSSVLCEEHINGLRRIHLEDNPFMWRHWPS